MKTTSSTPAPTTDSSPAGVTDLLAAAVAAIGGVPRSGQEEMAVAVAHAIETGEHLLVQAGTGTGKSLAYLVPALVHGEPVVVATATLALQHQLFDRDLPRIVDAVEPLLGRRPTFALAKGRSNYVCQHRLRVGEQPAEDDALFDVELEAAPSSKAGRDVVRIRDWATTTRTGDRDELVPGADDRAWRSLSVTAHECLGQRCPFVDDCFAERARERARQVDLVITNHSMLTIDALSDPTLLPEHSIVIVDEAHELADRATSAITDEITAGAVSRASRRARRFAGADPTAGLEDAADVLDGALQALEPGRVDVGGVLFDAMVAVRDAGHAALSAIGSSRENGDDLAARIRAKAAVDQVHDIAGRVVVAGDNEVVWVSKPERRPPALYRAPLFVGGLLREKLFGAKTVVMTSATLAVAGEFTASARSVGLLEAAGQGRTDRDADNGAPAGADSPAWRGLDVGSPFDYRRQAILYVAKHLAAPGRDGVSDAMLDELAGLIEAAGGRTLGLFSSMRGARHAAEQLRERLDVPLLCQGDDNTAELVRQFASDAATCLFGTLSLWQGVDVPGSACQLVTIDRLPFPRPDDPLSSARQRAVSAAGGNGFMAVTVPATALKLAQGTGRLIRTGEDRGVVAVLDSRLATARYAPSLRASLPPMWVTTDRAVARQSLASIAASAPPPLPVSRPMLETAAGAEVNGGVDPGESAETASTDRKGRRWTDEDEQLLVAQFVEGLPPSVLAESVGRSRGAVVARLKKLGVAGHVGWGEQPRSKDDAALAYDLSVMPAVLLFDASALADALDAEGWHVAESAEGLRVRRGDVDALVQWLQPDALVAVPVQAAGPAPTSQWLVAAASEGETVPPPDGADGVVFAGR